MSKKYSVEYSLRFKDHTSREHQVFATDDFLACEAFVQELLEGGMGIHAIRHEGVDVPRTEFDRIIRAAAVGMAADRICASLGINEDEERCRFGVMAKAGG